MNYRRLHCKSQGIHIWRSSTRTLSCINPSTQLRSRARAYYITRCNLPRYYTHRIDDQYRAKTIIQTKRDTLDKWGVSLIHRGQIFHICLVAWSALSHYLNKCWSIVYCTLNDNIKWNFMWKSKVWIQENALENVVWRRRPFCLDLNVLKYY